MAMNDITSSASTLWACVDKLYAFWQIEEDKSRAVLTMPQATCDALGDIRTHGLCMLDRKGDWLVNAHPFIPSGLYRRVDPIFLGWMVVMLDRAGKAVPAVPQEKLDRTHKFLAWLIAASKMVPADPAAVPVGYRKPDRESCDVIWDNIWGPD